MFPTLCNLIFLGVVRRFFSQPFDYTPKIDIWAARSINKSVYETVILLHWGQLDKLVKTKRPAQIENLLEKIRRCIESENYILTKHAIERQKMRLISLKDAIYVLTHGVHEKNKTSFDTVFQTWKYSIRGKTIDGFDIRVIVAFDEGMVVVTVIRLNKRGIR